MADSKISELDEVISLADTDEFVVASSGTTKRITFEALRHAFFPYETVISLDGPSFFWPLEDASGNPQDTSGNALHVTTVTGSPEYQAAGPAGRLAIRLSDGEVLSRATAYGAAWPWTFDFWMYLESISGSDDQYIFFNGNDAANGMGAIIKTAAGRKFGVKTGAFAEEADSTNAIPLNTWCYIAIRGRTGTFDTAYWFDGASDKAYDATSLNTPSGGSTRLGKSDTTYTARYFGLAMYPTALSDTRLLAHYEALSWAL